MSVKKSKVLIEAEARIVELEKQLAQEKSSSQIWYKQNQEKDEIIGGLHDILDDLGVRGYRDENKYTRIALPVRLFAWSMGNVLKTEKAQLTR